MQELVRGRHNYLEHFCKTKKMSSAILDVRPSALQLSIPIACGHGHVTMMSL